MPQPARIWIPALLCVSGLYGCAGNGEGLDESGRPITPGEPEPLTAEFDSIQEHVFTPICTTCHSGANAPQGLRLDAANSFDLLVGVPSTEVPSVQRVAPGDPDNSYLIQKLEGTAAVGDQMPLGGPPLPDTTIDVIRQWIAEGAQPSASGEVSAAFALNVVAPGDGDSLTEPPKRIVLGFNRELDATRVDSTSVRLERMDVHSQERVVAVVTADLSVPLANPKVLLITPRQQLLPGRYRVILDGRGGIGVSDLGATRIRQLEGDVEWSAATFDVESLK